MFYIILFLFSSFIFSEDFILEDINPSSEYYENYVGPSFFPNEVSIVYFGHYS